MILHEAYREIRSQFTGEMQFLEIIFIELLGVFQHLPVMVFPFLDRIVVFAHSGDCKDRVAEFFKGFLFGKIGEHHFRPFHGRNAEDAPLSDIVHRIGHQISHLGIISHVGDIDLFTVHIGHRSRFLGSDRNITGTFVLMILRLVVLPLRDL